MALMQSDPNVDQSENLKSNDLNFAENFHKAAVRLLHKRSVVIETKGGNEAGTRQQHLDHPPAHQQPNTLDVIMDKNLAESIATIRKNVTRVLQEYFRQINGATTRAAFTQQQQQQHEMPRASSSNSSQQLTNNRTTNLVTTSTTTTNSTPTHFIATMTSEVLENSSNPNTVNYYNTSLASSSHDGSSSSNNNTYTNVISTTMSHLTDIANATLASTNATPHVEPAAANPSLTSAPPSIPTTAVGNITYPSYGIPISSAANCSAIFGSYEPPERGK